MKTHSHCNQVFYHNMKSANWRVSVNNLDPSSLSELKAMRWSVLLGWLRYVWVKWTNKDNMIACEIKTNTTETNHSYKFALISYFVVIMILASVKEYWAITK